MSSEARSHGQKASDQYHEKNAESEKENDNPRHHNFSQEKYKPPIDFGLLKHIDWAKTPLGEMRSWAPCLKALASLLVTLPYAAAIFWGDDLIMIHNSAWDAISGALSGQGKRAVDLLGDEAMGRLRATMTGKVHDVDSANFFEAQDRDVQRLQTLLHPLCGEGEGINGVMAQFITRSNNAVSDFWKTTKAHKSQKAEKPDSAAEEEDKSGDDDGTTSSDKPMHDDSSKMIQDLPIDGRVLFQKFAHMIPTGLAILDSDAEALFVNDLFYKLTTHPGANPFRAWPQSIHPDDYERVMNDYKHAFSSDRILSTQFRSAAPGEYDSPSWRLFMMRPISDKAPIAQDGYICAIIDITSLKAAELYQTRIASEAIERKKQQEKFMDMISHEIRNPLSAILHCSEGILESIKGSPEGEDSIDIEGKHSKNHIVDQACLDDIVEAANTTIFCVQHQKQIVDDILSFSRIDSDMLSLSPSPNQPEQKIAQYLRIFQPELREKSIDIKFALDPSYRDAGVNWVNADMVRINQVLVNLMTNAIKFTARKNGERNITVSIGASEKRPTSYPPSVVFFKDPDVSKRMDATMKPEWGDGKELYLLVAVRDSGIGISDEDQARLFERFRQATPKTHEEYGGSGLGLFISRKLCQLHGGDIGVSSKEGHGSTFGFFFKVRRIKKPQRKEIEKQKSDEHSSQLVPDAPVDKETPESLINPPIESRQEVHPAVSSDDRYERSAEIAAKVDEEMNKKAEAEKRDKEEHDERMKEWEGGETRTPDKEKRPENLRSTTSQLSQRSRKDTQESPTVEQKNPPDEKKSDTDDKSEKDQISSQSQVDTRPGLSKQRTSRFETGKVTEKDLYTSGQANSQNSKPRTAPPTHVLLVEDNTVNQRVLKRHLGSKGFRVTTANNGQEAVDAHKMRLDDQDEKDQRQETGDDLATDAGQFDCVLMDQEMPVMDGNTATMTIRRNERSHWGDNEKHRVPIIGISANAREEQRQGMIQAGMDNVISKPFAMADLVKEIHSITERGSKAKE